MDTTCGICGSDHGTNTCITLEITAHIYDTIVPSRARLSLPDSLETEKMADGTSAVVTKCFIEKGTKFGPFVARKVSTSLNPNIIFPIKIFVDGTDEVSGEYYLDTTDETECNWMIFVTAAENIEEQNLICYQEKQNIFYVSSRDINSGEYLKVWYSSYYAYRIKAKPLSSVKIPDEEKRLNALELSKLVTKQQNIVQRDSWSCKFCGTIERNVVNFSSHILEHYALQLRKVCEICREAFSTRKGLKKHVKVVHSGSLGNTSDQIIKTNLKDNEIINEKNKKKDAIIGGPLLNDMLTDSLDNSNIMLQQTEMSSFDLENQNMLIESDNLNVDNIFNENVKGLEHFNFEIDETEERFVCDVCLKAFTKLKFLVMHLRKHTAKYFCYKCSKVFSRNENLKWHICNNFIRFECSICKKIFTQRKYLTRHMEMKHSNKFSCTSCKKTFNSNKEKNEHNCGVTVEKQTYSCITCNKSFYQEYHLKKHMKTHMSLPEKVQNKTCVCETCGKKFCNRKALREHNYSHRERTLECNICGEKFAKRYVLNNHILTHSFPQFKCEKCGKEFKLKKNLIAHSRSHGKKSIYTCTDCPKLFNSKSNMLKHQRNMHNKTCNICNKTFTSPELREAHRAEHLSSHYTCQFCNKIMTLQSSLRRHLKKQHQQESSDMDFGKIKKKAAPRDKNCQTENLLVKIQERVLNFDDIEVDFPTSFEMPQITDGQEVCLLPSTDQEFILDTSYMLENRNSTESRDLNKVVLYVLDQFPKV